MLEKASKTLGEKQTKMSEIVTKNLGKKSTKTLGIVTKKSIEKEQQKVEKKSLTQKKKVGCWSTG